MTAKRKEGVRGVYQYLSSGNLVSTLQRGVAYDVGVLCYAAARLRSHVCAGLDENVLRKVISGRIFINQTKELLISSVLSDEKEFT